MKKNLKPLVSVIMPVYNPGIYLVNAIESILNQTISNFEFIYHYLRLVFRATVRMNEIFNFVLFHTVGTRADQKQQQQQHYTQ